MDHVGKTPGIGMGIYTYAEAARLLEMRRDMIRRWVQGHQRKGADGNLRQVGPVIAQPAHVPGVLSFHDLIELSYVREFRKAGTMLQKIRKAHEAARHELGTPFPFATQKFSTDGWQMVDVDKMQDPITKQKLFTFVKSFLSQIDIGNDGLAERWYPLGKDHLIVLDPARSFGAPIEMRSGIRTEILFRAYIAEGENARAVADWYGVSPEVVEEAAQYERKLTAA